MCLNTSHGIIPPCLKTSWCFQVLLKQDLSLQKVLHFSRVTVLHIQTFSSRPPPDLPNSLYFWFSPWHLFPKSTSWLFFLFLTWLSAGKPIWYIYRRPLVNSLSIFSSYWASYEILCHWLIFHLSMTSPVPWQQRFLFTTADSLAPRHHLACRGRPWNALSEWMDYVWAMLMESSLFSPLTSTEKMLCFSDSKAIKLPCAISKNLSLHSTRCGSQDPSTLLSPILYQSPLWSPAVMQIPLK